MSDPLLRPTLADAPPAGSGPAPWRPQSLVYPAFFGGALAMSVLMLVQAHRLGAGRKTPLVTAIAAVAVVGSLATVLAVFLFYPEGGAERSDAGRWARLGARVLTVLAWAAIDRVLRPEARLFELRREEWSSLWLPGLGAVIGLGAVQAALALVLLLVAEGLPT